MIALTVMQCLVSLVFMHIDPQEKFEESLTANCEHNLAIVDGSNEFYSVFQRKQYSSQLVMFMHSQTCLLWLSLIGI